MIRFEAWNDTNAGMGKFYRYKHGSVIIFKRRNGQSRGSGRHTCAQGPGSPTGRWFMAASPLWPGQRITPASSQGQRSPGNTPGNSSRSSRRLSKTVAIQLCDRRGRKRRDGCLTLQPALFSEGRKINTRRRIPTAGGVAGAKLEGDFLVAVWNLQSRVAAHITPCQTRGRIGYLAIELGLSCLSSTCRLSVRRAACRHTRALAAFPGRPIAHARRYLGWACHRTTSV